MLLGLGVYVGFGQPVVNDVQHVLLLIRHSPNQNILRLHVSEDKSFSVYLLDPGQELYPDHENGLSGEPPPAGGEELLQVGPKKVQDHGVVSPALWESSGKKNIKSFSKLPSQLIINIFSSEPSLTVVMNPRQSHVGPKSLVEIKLQK